MNRKLLRTWSDKSLSSLVMNTGQQHDPGRSRRSKVYFIIGTCILVMLALFWSLDASIDYMLLGAAVFFFFLGFWNKPRNPVAPANKATPGAHPGAFNVQSRRFPSKKQTQPAEPSAVKKRPILPVAIFFITSFFFIIIVSFVFSGRESSEDAGGFFQKAEQFRWDAQYDSADHYYRKALEEDPENREALNGYGVGLLERERYEEALDKFERALQLDPDYEYARYNKALVYYYKKNYMQSQQEVRALLESSPSYYGAMVLAGDNYYMQQRYDSALYWYDEGYNNGERSAWLCHVLGYLYDEKGDQEKAIHLYQEALSYDSARIEIYTRLGELLPGSDGEQFRMTARQLKAQGF